ncbi:MAG TPA: hypothetical protein VHX65_06510 [Pirellulales bacterium]|nr:hypothetical protein [Pirellulales bacterium]
MTTTHEYRGYVFTIEDQPQDPADAASCADIAEIATSGETLAEAIVSFRQA